MHSITFFFCVLLMVFAYWTPADGLKCVCKPENCAPLLDCQWGSGLDACGCCEVCRQGPGEECGGPWNVHGRCGVGLECVKKNPNSEHAVGACKLLEPAE